MGAEHGYHVTFGHRFECEVYFRFDHRRAELSGWPDGCILHQEVLAAFDFFRQCVAECFDLCAHKVRREV